MTKNRAIFLAPLLLALFGTAFCIWSALGNDVNLCVTSGCTLYQDTTVFGISLWWFGAAAFTALAACALLGVAWMGRWLGALFLLGDTGLLILMSVTAPCVSCMLAALLFALCYFLFRHQHLMQLQRPAQPVIIRRSLLILIWSVFFIVNLGQVARSQLDIWPLLDESGQPTIRMFFSPTCRYCAQGVQALSGKVDVAFYPIADRPGDLARIDRMTILLQEGLSMAEALNQSQDAEFNSIWEAFRPDVLLLRFRLLRNKAHIFIQGSQGVPFFEYKGLPQALKVNAEPARKTTPSLADVLANPDSGEPIPQGTAVPLDTASESLPSELLNGTQCTGNSPCPPAEQTLRRRD